MIDIEYITLDLLLPSEALRVVSLQSFGRLGTDEPFRWGNEGAQQLAAIRHTLHLSQCGFGGSPADVTLLPEYSIPGVGGVAEVHSFITADDWPNNTVVIGGVEGLPKDDYELLCNSINAITSPGNGPNSVPGHQWVNCCITWIKGSEGVVQTWVQPKIRPAMGELQVSHQDMFCGSTINLFRGTYLTQLYPCYFTTFLCFDWIATGPDGPLVDEVLNVLNKQGQEDDRSIDLHFVFVLQHNPKPNHPEFQSSTTRFLTASNHPWVERNHAVVIQANTAACPHPGRDQDYGYTACVFSPQIHFLIPEARPTISTRNRLLRGSVSTAGPNDVVFREMGECIHLFELRVPKFVDASVGDRTYAIPTANVYPVGDSDDARLPGGPVSADLKWFNDSLDSLPRLSDGSLRGLPLMEAAKTLEIRLELELRHIRLRGSVTEFINCAVCNATRRRNSMLSIQRDDPDSWAESETVAFEHVLHSLTAIGIPYELELAEASPHAVLTIKDTGPIRVLAIRGESHEDCRIHFDSLRKDSNDPVLVITRDRDNSTPRPEEFAKIFEMDAGHGLQFLDYQRLMSFCRDADNEISLRRDLDEFIPRDRRII